MVSCEVFCGSQQAEDCYTLLSCQEEREDSGGREKSKRTERKGREWKKVTLLPENINSTMPMARLEGILLFPS